MRKTIVCLALLLSGWTVSRTARMTSNSPTESPVQLGAFSISLAVKDIQVSKAFYEKLGFKVIAGDLKQNYVILQNATSTIGLFQGMFPKNTLTFNPGWDRNAKLLPEFQDIRDIQRELKQRGLTPVVSVDESGTGPAFLTLEDPDGNPILLDQHVPKPAAK